MLKKKVNISTHFCLRSDKSSIWTFSQKDLLTRLAVAFMRFSSSSYIQVAFPNNYQLFHLSSARALLQRLFYTPIHFFHAHTYTLYMYRLPSRSFNRFFPHRSIFFHIYNLSYLPAFIISMLYYRYIRWNIYIISACFNLSKVL